MSPRFHENLGVCVNVQLKAAVLLDIAKPAEVFVKFKTQRRSIPE